MTNLLLVDPPPVLHADYLNYSRLPDIMMAEDEVDFVADPFGSTLNPMLWNDSFVNGSFGMHGNGTRNST